MIKIGPDITVSRYLGPLWYTWVVVDLCPKQAARWKFSVKIEEQGKSLETRQNVSPIDSNVDQILESGASWLWPRQHSKI